MHLYRSTVLLLVVLLSAYGCGNGQPTERNATSDPTLSKPSNLLVIVLDAASAKHFGCYGYARNTTPVVDSLANEGWVFRSAYTNAAYTLAATASLMTGLQPDRHGVIDLNSKLNEEHETLAELFRKAGYRTAAFLANGHASSNFGLTQGFQTVEELFRHKDYTGWAQDITNSFSTWVRHHGRRRFFAYLHYREPHDPYNPPASWIEKFAGKDFPTKLLRYYSLRLRTNRGKATLNAEDRRKIVDLYDANLAYADSEVGRVLKLLNDLNLFRNTTVIVTSDHGEAFWEHGLHGHNRQLYEESIRIPLIIKPAGPSNPRKIDTIVSTVDVFATISEWFSLQPAKLDGVSFLRSQGRDSSAYSVSARRRYYSLRQSDYKYIWDSIRGEDELYNLRSDPLEKENIVDSEPQLAEKLRDQVVTKVATVRKQRDIRTAERPAIDEETRENLKALGYIDE